MFVAFTLYTWRTTCEVFFPQIIGTSCLQLSGFDSTALDKSKINSFFQFKWLIDISFSTLCCKLSHIYRKFTSTKKHLRMPHLGQETAHCQHSPLPSQDLQIPTRKVAAHGGLTLHLWLFPVLVIAILYYLIHFSVSSSMFLKKYFVQLFY